MILVAPTSFKGTHAASDVAAAITRAVQHLGHPVITRPVSDGGPGLIDALRHAQGGQLHFVEVAGPLGAPVTARILAQPGRAIIESADACGIHLLTAAQRDPFRTTTLGVGELVLAAQKHANHVVVGLGGSATIDGGIGMARALGFQVHGAGRVPDRIEGLSASTARITALADVSNPLLGALGAARVFGPQKGATPAGVEILERELTSIAKVIQRDLGVDVTAMRSGGAAGGLGAGMRAFLNAEIVAGSEWVLNEIGFDALLEEATALITAEGAYDEQSTMGKITGELVARAGRGRVPVLLVAGRISGNLPAHVTAAGGHGDVTLQDVEAIVKAALPGLLAQ